MEEFSERVKQLDFKPTVLVENISEILTDAIVKGVFKGGDQLVEAELRQQFGVSRSPIRESFRILEKKGLVEILPRRGAFVKKITARDIEEHFPVRSTLEGLAAREAYSKMSQQDIDNLSRILENMKHAAAASDGKEYLTQHMQFHEAFIAASDNELLINLLKTLRRHSLWYRFSFRYYSEDFKKSVKIHEKIYRMFKSKLTDPNKLEQVVREHIASAKEIFRGYLEEFAHSEQLSKEKNVK
ncbi:MAG: GntR family transcriptional regulator [Desulfobacterales bacterium]|nr:MAG: GntR family transcriptional regulator [Desulfobacterales bacterium]